MTTPAQRHREAVLSRDRVCQAHALGIAHICAGRLESAHLPPKAWTVTKYHATLLRKAGGEDLPPELEALCALTPEDLIADPELGLALCQSSHVTFDLLGRRGKRENLPVFIEARCAELGLTGLLDRLYEPVRGLRRAA